MPIRFRLEALMEARELTGYALAQYMKMTPSAIYKLQKQHTMKRLNGETLALLCEFLECQPGDLLVYEPTPAKKKRGH